MYQSQRFFTDIEKLRIIDKLVDMRLDGHFTALWCDADVIRVQMPGSDNRVKLSWQKAADLTGVNQFTPIQTRALVTLRRIA